MEANFFGKTSLLLVETVFPVSEKRFFHLSNIPGNENSFSLGKRVSKDFFIPAGGNEFSI